MSAGQDLRSAPEVITFGCRLNAVDSQALRERRDELAGAVIVNTCAVTAEAVRQARQAIRRARRDRPDARLIVAGCAAQIDPGAFAAMDEVDVVVGAARSADAFAASGPKIRTAEVVAQGTAPPAVSGLAGRARAYVAIQNGCDHRCTFCVIPFGRGASRSKAVEAVVTEVRDLAARGWTEVVLTGVDLTSWGSDLPGGRRLGDLVAEVLAHAPELRRLRLSSIDAAEIDQALLALLATEPRLAPHLHLSLQSGDDLILKRMKRRHRRAEALELIASVRRARPETAFGADFIAGFPTESEAAFENTLAFVEEAGLAYLHVFPFSPRPGTPAARMPRHPVELVHARARRLREAGEKALARHLSRVVGLRVSALVERADRARAADFTEIFLEREARPGAWIEGVVADHDGRRARLDHWTTA